jgi:hypothetical protein
MPVFSPLSVLYDVVTNFSGHHSVLPHSVNPLLLCSLMAMGPSEDRLTEHSMPLAITTEEHLWELPGSLWWVS